MSGNSIVKEYFDYYETYKSKYGENTVILLEVGSFYEIYGVKSSTTNDIYGSNIVEICSLCNLNYSEKKQTYNNDQVIMAGFRNYMVDKYLSKLVDANYVVAVFDQNHDPIVPSKILSRTLKSIFSPGTYLNNEEKTINNNIMCIWLDSFNNNSRIIYGFSVINIFTGQSYIFEYETPYFMNPTSFDELERAVSVFCPCEVLIVSSFSRQNVNKIVQYIGIKNINVHVYDYEDEKVKKCMKQTYISEIIKQKFNINNYDTYHEFSVYNYATQSLCFLLDFMDIHNQYLTKCISLPEFQNVSNKMLLANHTLQQLNIINNHQSEGQFSSVLQFTNKCCTSMGKRLFHNQITSPCFDESWLTIQYEKIKLCLENENLVTTSRRLLRQIFDIEKITRILLSNKAYPNHIYSYYSSLKVIRQVISVEGVNEVFQYLHPDIINQHCDKIIEFIEEHFDVNKLNVVDFNNNFILPNVSSVLDQYLLQQENNNNIIEEIYNVMNQLMRTCEKSKSNNQEFVKKHETEKMGLSLILTKNRAKKLHTVLQKQSTIQLSSCVFEAKDVQFVSSSSSADAIVFPLLDKTLKSKLALDDKIQCEIQKAFYKVVEDITCDEHLIYMEKICRFVGNVDVVLNKAHISKKYNYCCPEIIESEYSCVSVENIRHCLIEHIQNNEIYVTNDTELGTYNQKGILLYGTNAVGKTSFIRALGICIILAQSGMFVPCSKFQYKPYKSIFSRIIGNDNLFKGLSTFAVEMSELRVILQKADQYSLILGDEVCSGTENESALSIFMAALMNIYDKQCSFIFATHFHEILNYDELKTLENLNIYHMHVVFDRENDTMIYDRKLKPGPGTKCYGLEVCKSLHLNDDFLNKAYDLRSKYFPESRTTLDFKTSKYNAKKIRGFCELCNNVLSQEVHHVNQQKDANNDGFIGSYHKNHVANLMSLCESCHNKQHH